MSRYGEAWRDKSLQGKGNFKMLCCVCNQELRKNLMQPCRTCRDALDALRRKKRAVQTASALKKGDAKWRERTTGLPRALRKRLALLSAERCRT